VVLDFDVDFGTVVDDDSGVVVVVVVAMTSAAAALAGVTWVGAGTVGASV